MSGAIGRLDRQKGFDTLISAFRHCKAQDLALHIYGEGAEEADLRRLAGDDRRIQFKGFASDPSAALAAVDVVAMPSRWEAYGLVALEALAAQRMLLVSGLDGLADHVATGAVSTNGTSVQTWCEALNRLPAPSLSATDIRPDQAERPEQIFARKWRDLIGVVFPENATFRPHQTAAA